MSVWFCQRGLKHERAVQMMLVLACPVPSSEPGPPSGKTTTASLDMHEDCLAKQALTLVAGPLSDDKVLK